MEGLDSMDEQTFENWKRKPWKCDFKSAMEREFDNMRDLLTEDQLAKLNAVITNVPKPPTPWGIVERIHERMTKKDDSTDGLNESMMNLSTTAAAAVESEAMVTGEEEEEATTTTQEQMSPEPAQSPETTNKPAEMTPQANTEQLLPWTTYMTRLPRVQAKKWAKYFEVISVTYQPMFKISIRDSDSIRVYKFNTIDERLQRVQVLCESGSEAGCSCLLTLKHEMGETLIETDLTAQPSWKRRRIRAKVETSGNWCVAGIMFGHSGQCGPTVMSGGGGGGADEMKNIRRTARSTIKTEYNMGRATVKQEPMWF